jgi:hypothetical protein
MSIPPNKNPAPAFTNMTNEQMEKIIEFLDNKDRWIDHKGSAYKLFQQHLDPNNPRLVMNKEYIYSLITKNIQPNLKNYDLTLVAARKCMLIIDPNFETIINTNLGKDPSSSKTPLPSTNTQNNQPPKNNYTSNNIPLPKIGGYKKQHRKSINAKSMKTPKRGTRVSVRRLSGENLSSKGITRNNRRKSRKTKLRKSMKK